MNSRTAVRLGVQQPRIEVLPGNVAGTSGPEAAEFGELVGIVLDPWQRHILDAAGSERGDGTRAAKTVDVLASRQNGKNGVLEVFELFAAVVLGEGVVHTAHQFKTAMRAHRRIRDLIAAHPDVASELTARWATPAQGYIFEFRSGGRIEFVARHGGSGRGFTDDILILDEAQDLTDEHLDALLPALSARSIDGDPQTWYTGSAPLVTQVVWQRRRKLWRAGGTATMASFEHSANPDADLDDRGAWAQANPGLGVRISEEHVEVERGAMSPQGFAQERLSISPEVDDATNRLFAPGVWERVCHSGVAQPKHGLVLAFDVNAEQTSSSIAVASAGGVGGLVDRRPGVGWAVDEVIRVAKDRGAKVALSSAGPAGAHVADLERNGVEVVPVGPADYRSACGWFRTQVDEDRLTIERHDDLDAAARSASVRASGDGFVWDRRTGDITALVALTLATYVAAGLNAQPAVFGPSVSVPQGNDLFRPTERLKL